MGQGAAPEGADNKREYEEVRSLGDSVTKIYEENRICKYVKVMTTCRSYDLS